MQGADREDWAELDGPAWEKLRCQLGDQRMLGLSVDAGGHQGQ